MRYEGRFKKVSDLYEAEDIIQGNDNIKAVIKRNEARLVTQPVKHKNTSRRSSSTSAVSDRDAAASSTRRPRPRGRRPRPVGHARGGRPVAVGLGLPIGVVLPKFERGRLGRRGDFVFVEDARQRPPVEG